MRCDPVKFRENLKWRWHNWLRISCASALKIFLQQLEFLWLKLLGFIECKRILSSQNSSTHTQWSGASFRTNVYACAWKWKWFINDGIAVIFSSLPASTPASTLTSSFSTYSTNHFIYPLMRYDHGAHIFNRNDSLSNRIFSFFSVSNKKQMFYGNNIYVKIKIISKLFT